MSKVESEAFSHGDASEGVAYTVKGLPFDMARISIHGQYPENSGWAKCEESDALVIVQKGLGRLVFRNGAVHELFEGDARHIPHGTRYRWDGDLQIVAAYNPPFDPDKYTVVTEEALHDDEWQPKTKKKDQVW